jgi:hypothetical protein
MRSTLVEFHRFNDLSTGALRKGDSYLLAAASRPVCQFPMPLDQRDLWRLMRDLRYLTDGAARQMALAKVGEHVTRILDAEFLQELQTGELPLQIDLVVNAAELAALPFEAATDSERRPLFVRAGEEAIEVTRRVRHDFVESNARWPAQPRILFAWASPPGVEAVPHEEHQTALRNALRPWISVNDVTNSKPVSKGVLTTLAQASLASIRETCRTAMAAEKPKAFSHLHLLAHGYAIGQPGEQRFGIALHHSSNGELDPVSPEQIQEALEPLRGQPVVITLAVCDAANETNTLVPEKSIAYDLHVSGFPVVVASQLPFTVAGSRLMVEHFYGALLAGRDVRTALHEARVALYENQNRAGHDWASLVGYVRLPEDYADHLLDVRLEAVMAALRTVQADSDELIKSKEYDPGRFHQIEELLRGRIQDLKLFLKESAKSKRAGVMEENLGLLGSSQKRLAELYFELGRRSGSADWNEPMRSALQKARDWYHQGYEHNLSHHWTGVQYLSLEAVLNGRILNPGLWHAAVEAALIGQRDPKEYWAHGSLAELYLLGPSAGAVSSFEAAAKVIDEMKARVAEHGKGDRFPLESTERQLRRYTDWWTNGNGFFPGTSDYATRAEQLLQVLCK